MRKFHLKNVLQLDFTNSSKCTKVMNHSQCRYTREKTEALFKQISFSASTERDFQ